MRKVKFAQDAFDEKLEAILTEFPILDVNAYLFFPVRLMLNHDPDRTCILSCRR
jgi:hypothetical protein